MYFTQPANFKSRKILDWLEHGGNDDNDDNDEEVPDIFSQHLNEVDKHREIMQFI